MKRAFAFAAILLLAAGCLSADEPAAPTGPTSTTATPTPTPTSPTSPTTGPSGNPEDAATLVEANNRLALDLFRALSAEAPGNLVVSPYSIATALQMVYGGADGKTRADMRSALRLGAIDATLDRQAGALLANLTAEDPNVTLRIGNSLWVDEAFAPEANPAFAQRIQDAYDGDLYEEDFGDPRTVDAINAWASNATAGKIPKVIGAIRDEEVMFLLNAVYFKGNWTRPFNASCTHAANFTTDAGARRSVDMMCGAKGAHTYAERAGATHVRLPYGDGRHAMYLVLPPQGTKLDDFVRGWDGNLTGGIDANMILEMPRFKMATRELDLVPALKSLGMDVAFTSDADFTRIAPDLLLSRVTHDAVLEVDEQGTVAAAVTTVGVGTTSVPPPPREITVDRPFLVALRDDATGSLLLLAKVQDPTAD